jgi:hypothetical protein
MSQQAEVTTIFRPRRGPRGDEGDVMSDLPARPSLDQLRHQAKDLLRAAQRGDHDAVARIGAVSGQLILSAAQLALAREYGFASWTRLKLEAERRDILNSRDLSRLTRLLAEHPELATRRMGALVRPQPQQAAGLHHEDAVLPRPARAAR